MKAQFTIDTRFMRAMNKATFGCGFMRRLYGAVVDATVQAMLPQDAEAPDIEPPTAKELGEFTEAVMEGLPYEQVTLLAQEEEGAVEIRVAGMADGKETVVFALRVDDPASADMKQRVQDLEVALANSEFRRDMGKTGLGRLLFP